MEVGNHYIEYLGSKMVLSANAVWENCRFERFQNP